MILSVDGWKGTKCHKMCARLGESVTINMSQQKCHNKCVHESMNVSQPAERWQHQSSALTSASNGKALEFVNVKPGPTLIVEPNFDHVS